jgi:1-acyl-sn-glycerol-3-phosphate acyltransferase
MTSVDTHFAGDSIPSRIFYRFARNLIVAVCRLCFRLTCEGREHVPPAGAYVIAPVHRSNVDILVACVVTKRRIRYMGKDSLWKKQPFRWLLSSLGGFPVTRGSADREALLRCIKVLKSGEPLVLYPEGERKSGPVVQQLFDGAVYVATKAGVPILPVGIGGTERVMGKGSKRIRFSKVHTIIGAPIPCPVAPDGGRVTREQMTEVSERLRSDLQQLFDRAQDRCDR